MGQRPQRRAIREIRIDETLFLPTWAWSGTAAKTRLKRVAARRMFSPCRDSRPNGRGSSYRTRRQPGPRGERRRPSGKSRPSLEASTMPAQSRSCGCGMRLVRGLLLALPGVVLTYRYARGDTFYGEYLHATGELGVRLLMAAMAITPLRLLLPSAGWVRWLAQRRVPRRRGFRLLAAARRGLPRAPSDVSGDRRGCRRLALLTGWIALFVMLMLAATSNDTAVRALRKSWKWLHRTVYLAAVLTFAHWIVAFDPVPGAIHPSAQPCSRRYDSGELERCARRRVRRSFESRRVTSSPRSAVRLEHRILFQPRAALGAAGDHRTSPKNPGSRNAVPHVVL